MVVALAIALLHFSDNFHNAIGRLEGLSAGDLDLLLGDFDAAANALLWWCCEGNNVQSSVVS